MGLKPLGQDFSPHLLFRRSGVVVYLSDEGKELVLKLSLNSPVRTELRKLWLKVWERFRVDEPELVLGWPPLLPDLTKVKSQNREGTQNCYFKQKERGELPDLFIAARPNHAY